MANKAISELPQAQNVNNQDLFVLEQSGIAKKLTAETFITEQGIIDALAEALDGHGGIQSVTLASVSGRIRTYRITFSDGSATTFQVYDGTSIERISRTSSSGLDDVYTVFLSDGTTTFFTVHNGADGTVSEAMLNDAVKDKAPAVTETTESSAIATFADGADNMPMHNVVAEIDPVQDLNGYDNPWPAGGGVNKFDESVFSNYGGVLQTSGVWHFDSLVNILNKVIWTAPESIGQITVTMWRKQSGVGSQGLRLVINYTDGTSVKVGNQNSTGGTDVYSVTTDASKTVRNITGDYGSNQNGTDVNVVVSVGSTAPSSYSPYSNICPITGHTEVNVTRTGKNLFNYDAWSGVAVQRGTAVFENNGVTLTATANDAFTRFDNDSFPSGARIPVKEGETIILSWEGTSNASGFVYIFPNGGTTGLVVANNANVKQISYTPTSGVTYVTFRLGVETSGTTISYKNIMVRFASSSDSTYEAYSGSTSLTASWQTEAGTVYGGTIDVATGLLTVDRAMVDLGTKNWTVTNHRANTLTALPDALSGNHANCICSMYKSDVGAANRTVDMSICFANNGYIYVYDTSFSGNEIAFKTAMNGVQLVYELATPQTYQLSGQQLATLFGNNTVWSDLGDVTVTYPADTKLYIEKLTQPTEDDLVANQAITSGKYFMIGNSLYLALANIASGAAITIGTNAQRVSLADALNAINS